MISRDLKMYFQLILFYTFLLCKIKYVFSARWESFSVSRDKILCSWCFFSCVSLLAGNVAHSQPHATKSRFVSNSLIRYTSTYIYMTINYIFSHIFCNILFSIIYFFCKVEFQVIDGSYMSSPPIMVHFSIRVAETNAPRVSWNMGTVCKTSEHNMLSETCEMCLLLNCQNLRKRK